MEAAPYHPDDDWLVLLRPMKLKGESRPVAARMREGRSFLYRKCGFRTLWSQEQSDGTWLSRFRPIKHPRFTNVPGRRMAIGLKYFGRVCHMRNEGCWSPEGWKAKTLLAAVRDWKAEKGRTCRAS